MDGNSAAAHVAYAFSELCFIYPITPSTEISNQIEKKSAAGFKNLFGNTVEVHQMQSESGVAGAVHGALSAGVLSSTFTSSQGLLLMIPNMYKMAGELLPAVFHVASRTVAAHALSIFGDHSDIYACRQTGFAMLCSNNPQEVMDFAAIVHLAAIEGRVPFLHFFDGFRTSHEIQKVKIWEYSDLLNMINKKSLNEFKNRGLSPNNPVIRGTAQNDDIYFQNREASNIFYNKVPKIVSEYMCKINKKNNSNYKIFEYYGDENAENIIVAMGSVCNTIEETIDYLNKKGEKVGLIKVRLYRPFDANFFVKALPATIKKISALNRTKEPGSPGEPLYLDVLAALNEVNKRNIDVFSGRYGLASKNVTPSQIVAVFENMKTESPKKNFVIGILDDVTKLSLDFSKKNVIFNNNFECKFWGFGSDGTVSATKNTIKIIGDNTQKFVQGYFFYDSKKSGGLTVSHLRFGDMPIKSSYYVDNADFVACHNFSYVNKYNMLADLKFGGTFLLNCSENALETHLPNNMKKTLVEKKINFYVVDAVKIAQQIGLGGRINTILQAAFFKIYGILPKDIIIKLMIDAAKQTYAKKGKHIVKKNIEAIIKGFEEVKKIDLPKVWESLNFFDNSQKKDESSTEFVQNILKPMNMCLGNDLKVSDFIKYADGSFPTGSSCYEKRKTAVEIPTWIEENCIQCNICSLVCPHAVIRPFVMTDDELAGAPTGIKIKKMTGYKDLNFSISISAEDCTACGVCSSVCPGKNGNKALKMEINNNEFSSQKYFDYLVKLPKKSCLFEKFKINSVKGSQFRKPLLEFSGACAGCGETPYVKLLTQLFGERLIIANATGCSSIWGASVPSFPYTNSDGRGPSWHNSLFENNAEFGFGITLAQKILRNQNQSLSSSVWIIGGDGWAYDIGFSGVDHIISSGKNVNILVLDTEVYSNTGGQNSKATPFGATAQFKSNAKTTSKKKLAQMMMLYENVYVAQVSMGANYNQCLKAFVEAESFDGPSLIIAYSSCINHGIKGGMVNSKFAEKFAVESGHFELFRYDYRRTQNGENPLIVDNHQKSNLNQKDFMHNETRFKKFFETQTNTNS